MTFHEISRNDSKMVENFSKKGTLVIGDRLETDIEGAHGFGLDACWFNPSKQTSSTVKPKYEIDHLSQLLAIVS